MMTYSSGIHYFVAGLFVLYSPVSRANEIECKLLHHTEHTDKKTAALICGSFHFEAGSKVPQHRQFDQCPQVTVDYKSNLTPDGFEYSLEITARGTNDTARFVAKTFPAEFRVEKETVQMKRKASLSDVHYIECRQIKSPGE